jgi:hypothetical protein
MKKLILTLTLVVLVLALAACGGAASEPEAASQPINGDSAASNENSTTTNENGNNQDFEFNMPTETLLMLGTVMLEETDYAVNADQASQLLPLWKALRSLGESETAAQVEVDAIVSQIEDSMTLEQIDAIEAMELTMQEVGSVAEILGVEMGNFGGRFGEMTPEMQATMEAMRENGEFQRPGGDIPGGQGPGSGFGGAEMDPAARETAMVERGGTRGARSGINTFLLDGLIEFLETKT